MNVPNTRHALSADPEFEARLNVLLERSLPIILAAAQDWRPRALLILGSAAWGEASGVAIDDHYLPLSDLDLGLIVESPVSPQQRDRLRRELSDNVRPWIAELRLTADPLDLGFFDLPYLPRMPRTLELAEVFSRPRLLWGDAACLSAAGARIPPPFEALRLLCNRVIEWLAAAPGEASSQRGMTPPVWPASPAECTWRYAHRWGKLVLDEGKAWLAAQGVHESALRARDELLRARLGGQTAAMITTWTAWRLAPHWPPPPVDLGALAALGQAVVGAVARDAGIESFDGAQRAHWLRLLAQEGGPHRERLRRWVRVVRTRPAGISRTRALRMASRWAHVAWPASLVGLGVCLAWLDAAGPARGVSRALHARLAREVPLCDDLPVSAWNEAWVEALRGLAAWMRSAGA